MDVRLSGEQLALRESAARIVDQLGPRAVGQLDDPERAAKLDAAVAASGWRELRTATDTGSPWASAVEAAIVAEELGRGLADTSFLGPTLAAELRRIAGAPPSRETETIALSSDLGDLADGPRGAVAIDVTGCRSALMLEGTGDGHVLTVVGLTGDVTRIDMTRPSIAMRESWATSPVNGERLDPEDVSRCRALGLSLTCADLVGTMRGAVRLACDYAASRHQYGVAVGSFQAVQHLLADAFVAMEGSRSVTLHAAWAVDALTPSQALAAASLAKAYCARAARTACETAIQVHGGIGNTWECLAHVYLRRALLSTDVFGGTAANLARVLDHRGLGGARGVR
jgi:alkylation response protein AidB-like acyl-CoA dehydrogenase